MTRIWKAFITFFIAYGRFGAGAASVHGMCEGEVAAELQVFKTKQKY